MKSTDLTGQRFSRLLVINRDPAKHNEPYWICRCDCGTLKPVRGSYLKKGNIKSCGCLRAEIANPYRKPQRKLHPKEYGSWRAMRTRCCQSSHRSYPSYGGRGITICERWDSFDNFYADMGPRPSPAHSLERRNNNLGYSPENCKWATAFEQAINKRTQHDNKSGIRGVSWDKRDKRWVAYIDVCKTHMPLGAFRTIEQATEARKRAEQLYWPTQNIGPL